jgi:hypothetical protein
METASAKSPRGSGCFQFVELQLQLLDLSRDPLTAGAEHHAAKLRGYSGYLVNIIIHITTS